MVLISYKNICNLNVFFFEKNLFYSQQINKYIFLFSIRKEKKKVVLVNNPLTCLPNQYVSYLLWVPADQNVKLWSLA
jgi:hypothetical protein